MPQAAKKKPEKTLWDRIKEGYTTIRELARAGKPKEPKAGEKKPKPKSKIPTTSEIVEIRRKAKKRADDEKRKAAAAKRKAPQ